MGAPWTLALVAAVLAAACGPGAVSRRAAPATAYDRYARALRDAGLDGAALGREWLAAADSAMQAPVPVSPPFQEAAHFDRAEARAVAYGVRLTDGERLQVTIASEPHDARLFADLFLVTGDTSRPFVHRATTEPDSVPGAGTIRFEARRDGEYVLRVQPELLRTGRFVLRITAGPSLAFPVAGHDNRAVLSVFGADRDGGTRRHHGIDIFAPRGTPVLAATDGVVRSTEPNRLGGHVVWLRDPVRDQTLYYAHLDRAVVAAGRVVRAGDTLGFVGNTGNARGTRPHLHFGIYRRGEGPLDPFPHVRIVTARPGAVVADVRWLGARGVVRRTAATLRRAPRARADSLQWVAAGTPVRVIAAAGDWYRVLGDDGVAGYLPSRQLAAAAPAAPSAQLP